MAAEFKLSKVGSKLMEMDLVFNKKVIGRISSRFEIGEAMLEFESEEEEDLEYILGLGKKKDEAEDHLKKDDDADKSIIVKQEPIIRVSDKYKILAPLI